MKDELKKITLSSHYIITLQGDCSILKVIKLKF